MPTFILSLNWTEQGIRKVKDAPKRSKAAKELAKKLGVDIKQNYLTSGEHDLLLIVDAAHGENVAKFALALSSLGMFARPLPERGRRANFKSSYLSFHSSAESLASLATGRVANRHLRCRFSRVLKREVRNIFRCLLEKVEDELLSLITCTTAVRANARSFPIERNTLAVDRKFTRHRKR